MPFRHAKPTLGRPLAADALCTLVTNQPGWNLPHNKSSKAARVGSSCQHDHMQPIVREPSAGPGGPAPTSRQVRWPPHPTQP